MSTITISLTLRDGQANFTDCHTTITAGRSVRHLFAILRPNAKSASYSIRVNGALPSPTQQIMQDDRVSFISMAIAAHAPTPAQPVPTPVPTPAPALTQLTGDYWARFVAEPLEGTFLREMYDKLSLCVGDVLRVVGGPSAHVAFYEPEKDERWMIKTRGADFSSIRPVTKEEFQVGDEVVLNNAGRAVNSPTRQAHLGTSARVSTITSGGDVVIQGSNYGAIQSPHAIRLRSSKSAPQAEPTNQWGFCEICNGSNHELHGLFTNQFTGVVQTGHRLGCTRGGVGEPVR